MSSRSHGQKWCGLQTIGLECFDLTLLRRHCTLRGSPSKVDKKDIIREEKEEWKERARSDWANLLLHLSFC